MGRGRGGVTPIFADLREITTGWVCVAHGVHVIPQDACDPWSRAFDHPRLWLIPGYLGVRGDHTILLGCLIACVFFVAALLVLPRETGAVGGLVYGLALCSPAVMLGVERGNADLLLCSLLIAAVFVLARPGGLWAGSGLLLLAGALKLAPILALPVILARRGRRAAVAAVAVAALFGAYVVATLSDIRGIVRGIPQGDGLSYGVRRPTSWVVEANRLHAGRARLLDVAVVVVALACAVAAQRWFRVPGGEADTQKQLRFQLFVAGASIYVLSYAITHNKDYRLVFTLLTVPQLLAWARERRVGAIVTLVALGGTLWLDVQWAGIPIVSRLIQDWNLLTTHVARTILPLVLPFQFALFVGLLIPLVAFIVERVHSPSGRSAPAAVPAPDRS